MTIDILQNPHSSRDVEILTSVIQDKEIRRNFLCMALFEELVCVPNPNIANLFVFVQDYESFYQDFRRADESFRNALILKMKFDGKKFSDFFIELYEENTYGKWFLEDPEKRETILKIIEQKKGGSLHLINRLESMLDVYFSEECEEKKIADIATFREFCNNKWITEAIKKCLSTHGQKLRESLQEKLRQKVPELCGIVQEEVGKVVAKEKGKS